MLLSILYIYYQVGTTDYEVVWLQCEYIGLLKELLWFFWCQKSIDLIDTFELHFLE